MYAIKEVVLCEGTLSFKHIIALLPGIPPVTRIKIFSRGGHGIIGSDSSDIAGGYISHHSGYRLASALAKRDKALADILMSAGFLLTFPLHLLLQKRPALFFKNAFKVIGRRKTWIGYAMAANSLPVLKPGIITVTGLPGHQNKLSTESLEVADKWYATNYTIWHDFKLVWKNYRKLGV